MPTKKKFSVYEMITEKIIDSLKDGVIPWKKPWSTNEGIPRSYAGRPYNGVNILLTLLACWKNGWDFPIFITRRKCLDEGGQILKGSKSTVVIRWNRFIPKEYADDPEECPADEVRWSLRYYRVFNIAQTTLPQPEISGTDEEFDPIDECESILYGMPMPPHIETGGSRACYSPKSDTIRMPREETFTSPEGYYATLFHELTHSTGHESRFDRFKPDSFDRNGEHYAKEELIAEIGASFLCAHAGITTPSLEDNTKAYIQSWISRLEDDPRLIISASKQAEKSTEFILGHLAS